MQQTPFGCTTQTMAHFYPQGVLIIFVSWLVSEGKEVPPVIVSQKEDATLPCIDFDPVRHDRLRWIKSAYSRQPEVILSSPKSPNDPDAGRANWDPEQKSLILTDALKSDEGLYTCEVCSGWKCTCVKNISLIVKDCKTNPAVAAKTGTTVTLDCFVNAKLEQLQVHNTSWKMATAGIPGPITSKTAEIKGTSLVIQDVKKNESAWYRCIYMVGQSQQCSETKLTVQDDINVVVTSTIPGNQPTSLQATSPSAFVSRTQGSSREQGSSTIYTAVLALAVSVTVVTPGLIGLIIYCRSRKRRDTHQSQWHPAVTMMEDCYDYEIVDTKQSEDPPLQQVCSLYQLANDETLYTF